MKKKLITSFKNYLIIYSLLLLPLQSTASKNQDFNQLEYYLKNITAVAIEFKQTDKSNSLVEGMLIINKPHQFRCNYYAPFPLLIVGNKNYISIYDYVLENLSRTDPRNNIFNFLLAEQVNFKENFALLSEKIRNGQYIVKMQENNSGKISEISFNQQNKTISSIKIFESNNLITLNFTNYFQIRKPDEALFMIQNPDLFGKPDRLTALALKKKLSILD